MFKEKQFVLQKKHLSCRQYDTEVDDKLSEIMKENRNKGFGCKSYLPCTMFCKEETAWKKSRSNLQEKPSCNCFSYRNKIQFFGKDANTTLLNDMNATQLHFDSSDSEDLNSKKKTMPLEISI